MMAFPETWEEYEQQYGFTDDEEVYTNGSRLIPSFRVKQWLEHLPSAKPERKKGKWIVKTDCEGKTRTCICGLCGYTTGKYTWKNPNYCQECGADMREIEK